MIFWFASCNISTLVSDMIVYVMSLAGNLSKATADCSLSQESDGLSRWVRAIAHGGLFDSLDHFTWELLLYVTQFP